MQISSTVRSVIVYGLVGLVLLGAIVLGVQVAKNRSSVVSGTKPATTSKQPIAQNPTTTQKPAASEPKKSEDKTPAKPAAPSTASTSKTPSVAAVVKPSRVPETGSSDFLMPAMTFAGLTFAIAVYVQSRRRLTALV